MHNKPTLIEAQWTTKAGLPAVVLFTCQSWRCGYVAVPASHPFHGKDYSAESGLSLPKSEPVGDRSPLQLLYMVTQGLENVRIGDLFDVHGGITFSGRLDLLSDGEWYFGFDCNHGGDAALSDEPFYRIGGHHWTLPEVQAQCESLATQLAAIPACIAEQAAKAAC